MNETTDTRERALELAESWQRDFPLCTLPFHAIGDAADMTGPEILELFGNLTDDGTLARIGATIRPNTVGASTLAAMAVPPDRLEDVAGLVNAEPSVNHNYQRTHRFNMWFVATASDQCEITSTLNSISSRTGLDVLNLPLERAYHIDLGFRLSGQRRMTEKPARHGGLQVSVDAADRQLLAELEDGLELCPRPYQRLAARLGQSEASVISRLSGLIDSGVISRFGCILRHRKLGFRANAMTVWDVPDDQVDELAERLAAIDYVTLCYRRARRLPHWPYNLFAMIHGRKEQEVRRQIDAAELATGLYQCSRSVLFSTRCFKQRGARYFSQLRGAA